MESNIEEIIKTPQWSDQKENVSLVIFSFLEVLTNFVQAHHSSI